MAGQQQRTYSNFSGGQNNYQGETAGPVIIDNGQTEALAFAEASTNWEMAENGLIKYAGDTDIITSPADAITTGEWDWKGIHILCKGGKVYTVSGASETQIYTGHTAGHYYQFTEWDDGAGTEILLLMNGYDKPLYYDGVTCTTVSFTDDTSVIWDDARPQGAMVFRGNIFYWGDLTLKHRIYKPRPGSYNNFDDTEGTVEAFDVDAGFGGDLTGLKALTNDLAVIYKQRAIRRMSGVNSFDAQIDPLSITVISDEFGCIAPRTLCQVGVDQYFLSEDGLRKLKPIQSYGDIDPQQPTYPIQGVINDLNFTEAVIKNSCAVFDKVLKHIVLAVPTGASTTNNLVIHHHVITGGNDLRGTDDMAVSVLAVVDRKIYHGDYNGQIYRHGDEDSYHGDAVEAMWESKWIAHNGIGRYKCYREMHIYAESDEDGSLIVQYQILKRGMSSTGSTTEQIAGGDGLWDVAIFDTDTFATEAQNTFKIKNLGRGNAIKIKLINSANNQRVKIRQVDLFYDVFATSRG
jgi:hypothetical protein